MHRSMQTVFASGLECSSEGSFLFCSHLVGKKEKWPVDLLKSCYTVLLAFSVLCPYLRETWVVLWSVIVVFLSKACLLMYILNNTIK